MEPMLAYKLLVPVLLLVVLSSRSSALPSGKDLNIPKIEAEAVKLTLADFEGDPIFVQSYDKASSKTKYHLLQDKVSEDKATFESKADDTGKEVILFPSDMKPGVKHTYVVLRKIPAKNEYYATYAYARDETQTCVEWDTWQSRDLETLVDCRSSVVAACGYNTSIDVPTKHQFPNKENTVKTEILPIKPLDGFTLATNSFFDDLDINQQTRANMKGRSMKLKLDVESSLLDANGAIKIDITKFKKKTKKSSKPDPNVSDEDPESDANGEDVHMMVTKRKKSTGATRNEYIPCKGSTCTGKLFKKVCTNGICEMKELNKNVNNNIYKLVWINVKIKVSDGTVVRQKIKKFSLAKVYTSPCGGPPRCDKYKRAWANDKFPSNPSLYILQKVKQPGDGAGGRIVEEVVTRYVPVDIPGIANLFKKKCTPVPDKEDSCKMVPLIDPNAAPDSPVTEANGEYTLFTVKKKPPAPGEEQGTKEYQIAPVTSVGNWHTKTCLKDKCTWQPVKTKPGMTFYKLQKVRRKLKKPDGTVQTDDVLRFDAVPGGTAGQLFVKTCYPDRCVLKPYVDDEIKNPVKFFKLVVQVKKPKGAAGEGAGAGAGAKPGKKGTKGGAKVGSTAKPDAGAGTGDGAGEGAGGGPNASPGAGTDPSLEVRTNKFLPTKVYKKVCKESGTCAFQIANAPEDVASYPTFELPPDAGNKGDADYIPITPPVRRQLYYEFCSTKESNTKCGMVPAVDEGQTKALYRLMKLKKKTKLPDGSDGPEEEKKEYIPTRVYLFKREQCKNETAASKCDLDLLTNFDNGVLKDRKKLYNIVTRTRKVKKPTGLEDETYNEFTPLDPDEPYFEKDCSAPDKSCVYRNIDSDPKNTIYNKTIGPDGKPDFVPVQLYGRLCSKDRSKCDMIPLKGDPDELKKFQPVFTLEVSKSVGKDAKGNQATTTIKRFLPLHPDVRDSLYRKVCNKDGGECIYKPLKEDMGNTFYTLTGKKKPSGKPGADGEPASANEYAPTALFKKVCMASKCNMEPLGQTDDPRKYPLFELKPKEPGSKGPQEYTPVTPAQEDKLYAKVCSADNNCLMKPLFQNQIYRAVPDGNGGLKYEPAKIYKKICDASGKCTMEALLPEDDPNKFPLFELTPDPSGENPGVDKFKSLPADAHDDLFKKLCNGDKCTFEPLFDEEHSIVKVTPKGKGDPNKSDLAPSDGAPANGAAPTDGTGGKNPKDSNAPTDGVASTAGNPGAVAPKPINPKTQDITPVKIFKKICDKEKCEMLPLNITEDPRKFELYQMEVSNKTGPKDVVTTTKTFEPVLSSDMPLLFKKDCKDRSCTLTPLFPEDADTVYKLLPIGGKPTDGAPNASTLTRDKYKVVLVFKKVCRPDSKDNCVKEQLLATNNPKEFPIFEQVTEPKGTVVDGKPLEKTTRFYNPITPQLEGREYFRKICNPQTNDCRMNPLFDDKDTIYRQMTIVAPKKKVGVEMKDEKSNKYSIVNIYRKGNKPGGKTPDFVQMTPSDDFTVPVFEMTMQKAPDGEGPKSKKPVDTSIKNYTPLPKDGIYDLYYKSCTESNKCIFLPIVEDNKAFFKLNVEKKDPNAFYTEDPSRKRFIPIRLFKKVCPKGDSTSKACTMERIKPEDPFPEQAFEEIYANKNPDPKGAPQLKKVYSPLPSEEIANIYKKICNEGSAKCMVPVRPDNIYKIVNMRRKIKHPDGTIETVDKTEFVPVGIFKRECERSGKSCEMQPFNSNENPKAKPLYELSILKSVSKKGDVTTIKRFLPVTPDMLAKLYRRKCNNETAECVLVPLVDPEIYIRTVIKRVIELPKGELEEERVEEMKPISVYRQKCRSGSSGGTAKKSPCEMLLISASDNVKPEEIYEILPNNKAIKTKGAGVTTPSPADQDKVLVKKYYPMSAENTERLYKNICGKSGNCTKVPMFPKLYYKWKIILKKRKLPNGKVVTEKFKDQVPVNLFTKTCKEDTCPAQPLTGEPDDSKKSPIYVQVVTRKPKPKPEVGDDAVKSYLVVPLKSYDQIHTRVCSKDGICIPKPFAENVDPFQPIYKLVHRMNTTKKPDGTISRIPTKEYDPVKLFKRVCDKATKDCVMKRISLKDGPISDSKEPIYVWVILLRRRTTMTGNEIEERVNKYITLKPSIAKNLFIKVCKTETDCKMEPIQPDDGIIYKRITAKVTGPDTELMDFAPVKLFTLKCKDGSAPKPPPSKNPDCVLQPAKKDQLDDPTAPIFMMVTSKKKKKGGDTPDTQTKQLVPLTPEDIKRLAFRPCKKPAQCKLVPVVNPLDAAVNSHPIDPTVDFSEVPSDSSLEVDQIPENGHEELDTIDPKTIPNVPTESNSINDVTGIPTETNDFVITEEQRTAPLLTTTQAPVVQVSHGDDATEAAASMVEDTTATKMETPVEVEEPVAITDATPEKYLEVSASTADSVTVVVTRVPAEANNQAITESNTETVFTQPVTKRSSEKPITQDVTRSTEKPVTVIQASSTSKQALDKADPEFDLITEPPEDESANAETTTLAIEEVNEEPTEPYGEEQKVMPPVPAIVFKMTEPPIKEPKTPKQEMFIIGEVIERTKPTTTPAPQISVDVNPQTAMDVAPEEVAAMQGAPVFANEPITESVIIKPNETPIQEPQVVDVQSDYVAPDDPKNKKPKAKGKPTLGVSFQTPDEKVVTFMTHPDVTNPGSPLVVFELVFEIEDENNVSVILPVPKNDKPSKNSLKLVYSPDDAEDTVTAYILPEVPYDITTNPKSITFDAPRGTVVIDFPDPSDESRDGIIMYLTSKPAGKKYKYELPGMNVDGFKELQQALPKKAKTKKLEIIFKTIDKKQVAILTNGEPKDPKDPYEVLSISFELPATKEKVVIQLPEKNPSKKNLELVNTNRGESKTYEFPGVPAVDPRDGATKITFKTAAGTVVFDIPSASNEFRNGVILILKQNNGKEEPYELSGVKLKGSTDQPKIAKTLITFQTIDDKDVTLLTTSSATTTIYQIISATFDDEDNSTLQLATSPKGTGTPPVWLPLQYTSLEGEVMQFEVPGIPYDGKGGERKFTFTSATGSVSLTIPPADSKKLNEGLEFLLTTKKGKKIKYKLCRFIQILKGLGRSIQPMSGQAMAGLPMAGRAMSSRAMMGRSLSARAMSGRNLMPANSANLLFFHPGWKLQYQTVKPKITLKDEKIIFYGLGNCPYKEVSPKDLDGLKSVVALVEFYTTVLRTECLAQKKEYINSLIAEKYIAQEEQFFTVPEALALASKPKLNSKEAQKLSSAFEVAAMTKTYAREAKNIRSNVKSPDSLPISPSVSFLTYMSFEFIKEANAKAKLHFVRLTRSLVGTLKTGFTKLNEDDLELQFCAGCTEDIPINYNDRVQLLGLMQFLIHGLEPIEQGKMEPEVAFNKFYVQNKLAIESRVKSF